jgi:hypothetical protein
VFPFLRRLPCCDGALDTSLSSAVSHCQKHVKLGCASGVHLVVAVVGLACEHLLWMARLVDMGSAGGKCLGRRLCIILGQCNASTRLPFLSICCDDWLINRCLLPSSCIPLRIANPLSRRSPSPVYVHHPSTSIPHACTHALTPEIKHPRFSPCTVTSVSRTRAAPAQH